MSFIITLSWIANVTAGHTKRVTTNALVLTGYCFGNLAGPFMWQAKFQPRYHVPWTVIGICDVICPCILLIIRALLVRENRRRDREQHDDVYDNAYVEGVGEEGEAVAGKVDRVRVCHIIRREWRS